MKESFLCDTGQRKQTAAATLLLEITPLFHFCCSCSFPFSSPLLPPCLLSVPLVLTLILSFSFSSLQKYVREQILLAVAVIVKRGSLDKSINCKSIFHEVGQLISSGNPTVVRGTCSCYSAKFYILHVFLIM